MADNINEALELVQLYKEKTEEHLGGLQEVYTYLSETEATFAEHVGTGNETVEKYAAAGGQIETLLQLVQSSIPEYDNLISMLAAIQ